MSERRIELKVRVVKRYPGDSWEIAFYEAHDEHGFIHRTLTDKSMVEIQGSGEPPYQPDDRVMLTLQRITPETEPDK